MPQVMIGAVVRCHLFAHQEPPLPADDVRLQIARVHEASLGGGGLYWVTEPMARLAMDAAADMPGFDYTQAPNRSGMIGFQSPLPPLKGRPISAISWAMIGDHVAVITWAKPTGKEARSLLPGHLVAVTWTWVCTDTPLENLSGSDRGLLAFLNTAWVLMMTPTVAERTEHDTVHGGLAGTRSDYHRVNLVDLRPLREVHTPAGATDGSGRTYRHRWMVRGHWAHRAHGPGGSLRRLVFIEPYIKGPAGAPLKTTDTVMVWRR